MKYNCILLAVALAMAVLPIDAQNTTKRSRRTVKRAAVETFNAREAVPLIADAEGDSAVKNGGLFDAAKITITGYDKRVSDYRESFFITNHTPHTLSAVQLLLRYFTPEGEMLHEATRNVRIELKPEDTRKVNITSFDTQSRFYYYKRMRPRNGGAPFKVMVKVQRYDIVAKQ